MSHFSLRYARALFRVGQQEGLGADVRYGKLLMGFKESLTESPALRLFLSGQHVHKLEKKRFVSDVFKDPEDVRFLNFLKVLIDKDRMDIIDSIALDYRRLELDSQKTLQAIIESAFPVDEKTVDAIRRAFIKKTGARDILATVRIVPELIGGVRVVIGSLVYDGSIRSELDRLHEKMKN